MRNTLLFLMLLIFSLTAFSHNGRRDAHGGHLDRSSGVYHCHKESCIDPGNINKDEIDALDGEPELSIAIARSWGQAKVWARDIIYAGANATFYCGCTFEPKGTSGGKIDKTSCSYDGDLQKNKNRSKRLEWEHIVPASLMPARSFQCWNEGLSACTEGGRKCCEQHDLKARIQIFDLHNLVPSVGQANALRSNKRYGIIEGEDRKLGSCDFEWSDALTEPGDSLRGDVARTWLYYFSQYGLQLKPGEFEMLKRWSKKDPPSEWEILRNSRIKELQGSGNPFIEEFNL